MRAHSRRAGCGTSLPLQRGPASAGQARGRWRGGRDRRGSAGTAPGPLGAARQRGAVPPGWAEAGRGEGGAVAAALPGQSRSLASRAKRREQNACPAVSREPPRPRPAPPAAHL